MEIRGLQAMKEWQGKLTLFFRVQGLWNEGMERRTETMILSWVTPEPLQGFAAQQLG